jgi:hypothetical protein
VPTRRRRCRWLGAREVEAGQEVGHCFCERGDSSCTGRRSNLQPMCELASRRMVLHAVSGWRLSRCPAAKGVVLVVSEDAVLECDERGGMQEASHGDGVSGWVLAKLGEPTRALPAALTCQTSNFHHQNVYFTWSFH